MTIIRTPTEAKGGITEAEKAALDMHAETWIDRAMRTDPIDPDKITPAIKGIYAAAGLKEPRVIIVPSPMVMAFAYGASAAIWHKRKAGDATATRSAPSRATHTATNSATRSATHRATDGATHIAAHTATYIATRSATSRATRNAINSAEKGAEMACRDRAGNCGIMCAARWYSAYQGGNMWAALDSFLTGMRDVIGLRLPVHEAYAHWEQAAIHGGFRVMHEEFCMVSDFPEFIRVDENNEPHCDNGPSHRWRDGWELHHWHGTKVPAHWIETPNEVDPAEVIASKDVEQRAAGAQIVG